MILEKHEREPRQIIIDLAGPEGNAFCLIAYAVRFGKNLDWSREQIEWVKNDMTSGDYNHLITVFDHHFGDFIILQK